MVVTAPFGRHRGRFPYRHRESAHKLTGRFRHPAFGWLRALFGGYVNWQGSGDETMTLPGFTAASALFGSSRRYRLSRGGRITTASGVQAALINQGGGGGTNFWCDPDGTCSCLGGSLSQDCWLMQQYCVTGLDCRPYPPYKCTCDWMLRRPTGTVGTWPGGSVSVGARAGF